MYSMGFSIQIIDLLFEPFVRHLQHLWFGYVFLSIPAYF